MQYASSRLKRRRKSSIFKALSPCGLRVAQVRLAEEPRAVGELGNFTDFKVPDIVGSLDSLARAKRESEAKGSAQAVGLELNGT